MRSAAQKLTSFLGVVAALAATAASAAPTISGWTILPSEAMETVQIRWSEEGSFVPTTHERAGQYVIVIPGAALNEDVARNLDVSGSEAIRRARLQRVTTADGNPAIQLTLTLAEGASVSPVATAEGLALNVERKVAAPAVETHNRGMELTDDRLRELDTRQFGASDAPRTGAGQMAAPASNNTMAGFYVPPQVERGGRVASTDPGTLAVQDKLNEVVRRVDFQGTSLENVLRLIADQAELNILIKPSDVQGRTVTLRLRDVTLRQLMDALLKQNDLGYIVEPGGIVNIVPRSRISTSDIELTQEVIAINWIDAREVAASIKPIVDSGNGKIEVSQSSNSLIVYDTPENVERIRDLVGQIDVPEKQVDVEVRLVNMTKSAARDLGMRTSFENVGNGLNSDVPNTITQFAGTESEAIIPRVASSIGDVSPNLNGFSLLATNENVNIFGNRYNITAEIEAEERRGNATTLANPRVTTTNNVEALIDIIREEPYQSGINTDQGSVATIQFKETGTRVQVLPRITNNGFVAMRIQPRQIILVDRVGGSGLLGVPRVDEQTVTSSVIVKDESTIMLGGLREFSAITNERGVPFLLRVPVFSWLFKSQTTSQDKKELYLFVTPSIVKDPTPNSYQMALYNKIDYNWDLPDEYFSEIGARMAPGEELDPSLRAREGRR